MRERIVRTLLLICGTTAVILGTIGIFIPVLPTTPFLVLAAFCFMRSSERFYQWLLGHRLLGHYLKNYWEGRGIALKQKVLTIAVLWVSIGFSAIYVVTVWWGRLILLIVAVGVTAHLVAIKTLIPEQEGDQQD